MIHTIADHYDPTRVAVVASDEVATTIQPWFADASEPDVIADRLQRLQQSFIDGTPDRHLQAVLGLDVMHHVSDVRRATAQVIAEWKASGQRFSAAWFLARRDEILDNR